jgi:hypothetical protein
MWGVGVEAAQQGGRGEMVDQLAVDVQHQAGQWRVVEGAFRRAAGPVESSSPSPRTPSSHTRTSPSSWASARAALPAYEKVA